MPMMKTSNPAFGQNAFKQYSSGGLIDASARMTLSGTVNKTAILFLCALATAAWTWKDFMQTLDPSSVSVQLMVGLFGGMIFAFVTIFKKEWAPVTAPIYALLEGMALGGISAYLNSRYPGIAFQAVSLTFGTLFVMLFLFRSGIIKVTDKFRMGIFAATGGICLFYLASMLLGAFHISFFESVWGSGAVGIGFSLIVVAIAALNLVLDFDFIDQGVNAGAPKFMEWYGGFGIMVTMVWLYIEILNLLAKTRRR
jgi:uncharacterized YccA/Bax inhibitor family protein